MAIKLGDIFNTTDLNINNPKIEEMLNKTKDVAEVFGKRSAERIELSKKKIELLDTKTKLSKLYESFGKYQYNAYMNGTNNDEEVQAKLDEITALEQKCDELNMEIEYAKAEFNESIMNMAQKTKEAFQGEHNVSADDMIDMSELFETDDEIVEVKDNSDAE